MRTALKTVAAAIGAASLAATYATSAALADSIVLSGPSVVSAAPSTNVGFTAYLVETSGGGDLNNCNVNAGSGNAATLSFTSSNPAVADAPASVTVTACDDAATPGFEGGVAVSVHVKSGATGSTTITVQGAGGRAAGPNTSAQYATDSLTINVVAKQDQAALSVVAATPQTYGTTQLLSTSGGTTGGAVTYATSTPSVCSITGASLTMLTGTGTCSVTATMAGSSSYHDVTSAPASVAAAKATPVVSLAGPSSATFGDDPFPVTGSVVGDNGSLVLSSLTASVCAYASGQVSVLAAGTCTIQGSTTADDDYAAASTTKDITVGQAGSSVSVICPSSVVYTGSPVEPCSASVSGAGLSQGLTPTYSDNVQVGTATASAAFDGDANHTGDSASATFEITKAATVVAVTCPSARTYTGSAIEPCTARVTGAGGLDLDLPVSYADNTDAGTPTASASYAGDANHEESSGSATFTIEKAASTTTVTCSSPHTYTGSAIEPCTATVSGAGGLSEDLAVAYADNTDAGTATASASYAGDANHEGSSDSTTFVIDKAPTTTTVTCPSVNLTYTGEELRPCSAGVTGAGGLDEVLDPAYADNVNAGTATASASYAGDANHEGSSDSTTFVIDKATSTTAVTCPVSVVYSGAAQTPCSAAVTGAGGLSTAATVSYADNVNAGTATASASYAGDANHEPSSGSATFEIDKKDVTVTASSATVTLGSAVPTVTPSYAGFVSGQGASVLTVAPTCGTTYGPASPIGSYATSCSGAEAQNYSFAYVSGTITVIYPWSGFFQPIDTADGGKGKDSVVTSNTIFNKAKAGSTIPVKFSLGGDRGLGIFEAGYPKAQRVNCNTAALTTDAVEETTTTSGLKYDATTQQYNYAWKTSTSFVGTCQRLEVKLVDGKSYYAFFTFTK